MSLRPLDRGSLLGIVAPASAPLDTTSLDAGLSTLRSRGLELVSDPATLTSYGYLAGSDQDRADAFNRMIHRTDLDMLMCVRGGYGTLRLLDRIDYASAREAPKVLIGYSDVTALQLALLARSGWKSLSGPMVAVDWVDPDTRTESLFWRLARGSKGRLESPTENQLNPLRLGEAEGILLGGNLSIVTSLLGTPYFPDVDGAILFLEDVDEAPYRVDGCLAQLRLSGVLERLGGLVLGTFSGWKPREDRPTLTYHEVFEHYATFVNGPVVSGLVYGHIPVKSTLPIGVRSRLLANGSGATLDILESVIE